ncbi:TerD family protein (plasmid) [Pseudomonas silesiensis]|uniref:TerD family protein n=1 Tax=Pseudomonas silesiensis TaxID=1853130 RepID=UPI0030CB6075
MSDMIVNLSKDQRVSLTKRSDDFQNLRVGLSWDAPKEPVNGFQFDLDASVLILDPNGKCHGSKNFIFYGNPESACGAIKCGKDSLDGAGEGDDEQITLKRARLPETAAILRYVVSIHDAKERGHDFGQVKNASFRIEDIDTGKTLLRFSLTDDYKPETGVVMADIYREDGNWKVRAVGQGYREGLQGVLAEAGLLIG